MKQKVFGLVGIITGLMSVSLVSAREFRVPLQAMLLSHDFEPKVDEGLHVWVNSVVYNRQANRAFMKHGMSTKHLSALFFNKDEFRLSKVFENCLVARDTQYYNPFMRVMKIRPRVSYYESGMVLSGSIDKELILDKGRIGIRVSLPFRTVELVRRDLGSRRDSQIEDVQKFAKNAVATTTAAPGFAYRLDFLEALPQSISGYSAVTYSTSGINVFDNVAGVAEGGTDAGKMRAAAVSAVEGQLPETTLVGVSCEPTGLADLPITLSSLSTTTYYKVGTGDYSALSDEAASTVAARIALQDKKAAVWITSTHRAVGEYTEGGATESISGEMTTLLKTLNVNTYEWLHDRGYVFDSSKRVGVGDLDLEVFYEHVLSDRLFIELIAGVSVPLSSGNNYAENPYRAYLGNGEHWEVRLGGKGSYEIMQWCNIVLDAAYSLVLDGKEWICSAPEGSLIKNIGSKQEATVSWGYFVGNLDVTFQHPQTSDLTGTLGYQLYYKDRDSISYKTASVESWLGKKYNSSAKDYSTVNNVTMSGSLAAANTEQYAHRIKTLVTYHISDWCTFNLGGSFTFAGQNCQKSVDIFGGCAVSF